jgi:hypothetical protein
VAIGPDDIAYIIVSTSSRRLVMLVVTGEANGNQRLIHPFVDNILWIHRVRMLRAIGFS